MDEKLPIKNKTNLVKVNKTNKDEKIVVRMDAELKEQFTKYVESKGATLSDYIRQMIVQEMYNESMQDHVTTKKDYNQEIDVSKEIMILKEQMIALEYRLNEKLNENKEQFYKK